MSGTLTGGIPGTSEDNPIAGFRQGKYHLTFWCDYCIKWHLHGRSDHQIGDVTDRVAHCRNRNTPLKREGVWIRVTEPDNPTPQDVAKMLLAEGRNLRDKVTRKAIRELCECRLVWDPDSNPITRSRCMEHRQPKPTEGAS